MENETQMKISQLARTYDTSSMVMDKDFGNELNARM